MKNKCISLIWQDINVQYYNWRSHCEGIYNKKKIKHQGHNKNNTRLQQLDYVVTQLYKL